MKSGLLPLVAILLAGAVAFGETSPATKKPATKSQGKTSTATAKTKTKTKTTASKATGSKSPTSPSKGKTAQSDPKPTAPEAKPATTTPDLEKPATPTPTPSEPDTPEAPTKPETPAKETSPEKKPAAVSSMLPEEIDGFDDYPANLQEVVRKSLALTTQNLRYQYGSSDPKAGGMDCSGTMFRVLHDCGLDDVPRQSDEMCRWVTRRMLLYRTEGVTSLKDPAFTALTPGDLLFWTGTYETSEPRELPISHVMIYLGKRKKDGKPVVFGSSDGRTYEGQRRNGVSVFDFNLPKSGDKASFYGYGPIPGLDMSKKANPPEPPKPPSPGAS